MKTNQILFVCLIAFSAICISGSNDSKEIIGSGIFEVNEVRSFTINNSTVIYLDDVVITHPFFEIIGSGYKSTFIIKKESKEIIGSGIVDVIRLETNLKGPITSLNPFEVLEQPIHKTSDTNLDSFPSNTNIGESVSVSGYLSNNNSLKATKIMSNLNQNQWKVRGYVSNKNTNNFKIGSLKINLGSEQVINCSKSWTNGSMVEVRMLEDVNYVVGTAIDTLESIECLKVNQLVTDEVAPVPTIIQGFISDTQGLDFWLNDIKVNTDNLTLYENGRHTYIDEMVNVEVTGILDPQTSQLQAGIVRFVDHRIKVEFPIIPADIILNQSITINGVTYYQTAQTKDPTNLLQDGIKQAIQVGLEGYLDSSGAVYLTKIKNKGQVNYDKISLRGDIFTINNPLFDLLNFSIDASSATIIKPGQGVIDVSTFYDLIFVGSQVDIKNGEYDLNTNRILNAKITIHETSETKDNQIKEIIGSGFVGLFGTATITSSSENIFYSSFE